MEISPYLNFKIPSDLSYITFSFKMVIYKKKCSYHNARIRLRSCEYQCFETVKE